MKVTFLGVVGLNKTPVKHKSSKTRGTNKNLFLRVSIGIGQKCTTIAVREKSKNKNAQKNNHSSTKKLSKKYDT